MKPIDQMEYKAIGQTPLNFRADEIEKKYEGSGPISVEYRKEGYQSKKVMITELSAVDLKVKMELMAESGLEDQRRLNWVVDSLFEVKRLVSAKRYDDAIELLKKVKEAVPQVSAVYELEGGIYFIQNKLHAALDSYTMSVRYNPKNMESIRMKEFVEQKIKGSR
ncbi:MAG: hypothetical protein EP326_12145 [Deltaproteobacteria bacterium]|nr:MAG: hypothetical protein EP326_12145 [Deltaproteobacteria bacterium]